MQCNTGTSRTILVWWQCIVHDRNLNSEIYMMAYLEFQNVLWTLKPTPAAGVFNIGVHNHSFPRACVVVQLTRVFLVVLSKRQAFLPYGIWNHTIRSHNKLVSSSTGTRCSPGRPRRAGSYESLCGNTDPPSSWRGPPRFFILFTSSALNGVKYVLIPQGLLKTLRGMETYG